MHTTSSAILAILLATGVPAAAAAERYDDAARREGTCAGGIAWRMEARSDDGRIEVKVRVDTDRYGQRWSWVLRHNGSFSDRGTSRAVAGGASYEIERTAIDVGGSDTFRLRTTHRATVCVAHVTL